MKKNNTVSHFYISKYGTFSYNNNNYIIEKKLQIFILNLKINQLIIMKKK